MITIYPEDIAILSFYFHAKYTFNVTVVTVKRGLGWYDQIKQYNTNTILYYPRYI